MILVFAIFSAVARAIAFNLYFFTVVLDGVNDEPVVSNVDEAKSNFLFIELVLGWYEMLTISA